MSAEPAKPKRMPILGCIADDVTGATDLAINLVQGGMCVVQLLDIPTVDELHEIDADAVVVGLKTRSIDKLDAVELSVRCLRVLLGAGVTRFFFKYCSTFDSTSEGNIGPVAVALMDALEADQTIFCPAFPRNGRTVYQGHLFVDGALLNESGMENHPLNPMSDANLVRFLGQQCDRDVGLLRFADIEQDRIDHRLDELKDQGFSCVVADACSDTHLETIAESVARCELVTGGSGIGRYLPAAYRNAGLLRSNEYAARIPRVTGRSLIIAGSCSTATNRQVAWMHDRIPCWAIDIDQAIADKSAALGKVMDWAHAAPANAPLLISSTASPERVAEVQRKHGAAVAAKAIEDFLSDAATSLVSKLNMTRLIVAGGETAGAVVQRLGVHALRIDAEICPGVPWTESMGNRPLALALKSGNFGAEDFFEQALRMLP